MHPPHPHRFAPNFGGSAGLGVTPPVDSVGDINGDGMVDSGDLGILIALWNTEPTAVPEADLNGDGTVNSADIGLLIGAWGECP